MSDIRTTRLNLLKTSITMAPTFLVSAIALVFSVIGGGVAFSNMQTADYSPGSIGWAIFYTFLVFAFPAILVLRFKSFQVRSTRERIRIASYVSLLLLIPFVPFLFLLTGM